jgi:hypothetical protein
VTLVGAQLLGVRWAATSGAALPKRWWDQRGGDSLWRELSVEPARRRVFADDEPPRRVEKSFVENKDQCATAVTGATGVAVVQEDKAMQKVGSIGKFLQIGSVVQGSQRSSRWFSLPGSWRAPRVQIMRHRDQAASAECDEQRAIRQLAAAGSRRGW